MGTDPGVVRLDPGEDDHLGVRGLLPHAAEHLAPGQVGKPQVEDDHVRTVQRLPAGPPRRRHGPPRRPRSRPGIAARSAPGGARRRRRRRAAYESPRCTLEPCGRGGTLSRQGDDERPGRPLAAGRLVDRVAALCLGELPDDVEPQPRPPRERPLANRWKSRDAQVRRYAAAAVATRITVRSRRWRRRASPARRRDGAR